MEAVGPEWSGLPAHRDGLYGKLAYFMLTDNVGVTNYVVMSKVPGFDAGRTDMARKTVFRSAFKTAIQFVHLEHAKWYELTACM